MKMTTRSHVIALVGAALLPACAGHAPAPRDVALELAFDASLVIDYGQTNAATAQCREGNPVLGRCGGSTPAYVYFPAIAAVHAVVAAAMPEGYWRTAFQAVTLGVAVENDVRNLDFGLGMQW